LRDANKSLSKDALAWSSMARLLTNYDVHVIWEQIGEDLDFTAGRTVAAAFLAIWAQEFPEEVTTLVDQFRELLPIAT
jgi:hypothetical protein